MATRLGMSKVMLFIFFGVMPITGGVSLSRAALFLSTDVPASLSNNAFTESDIIKYEVSDFSLYLSGASLGIDKGVNRDAIGFSGSGILFSLDVPASMGGVTFTERDLILYDGMNFSKLLDGEALGIPGGANIDAATLLADGSIVFSLDIPVSLAGLSIEANDLVAFDGFSLSLYFSGADNGIPESADIDGVWVSPAGEILFSLDTPCSLDGLEVKENDIVRWADGSFSKYLDGSLAGMPEGVDIDAVQGSSGADLDSDGDSDGSDLGNFAAAFFAAEKEADINGDGLVDSEDLGIFAAGFGRGGSSQVP